MAESTSRWTLNFTENLVNVKRWVDEADVDVGEQLSFIHEDGRKFILNFWVKDNFDWGNGSIELEVHDMYASKIKITMADLAEIKEAIYLYNQDFIKEWKKWEKKIEDSRKEKRPVTPALKFISFGNNILEDERFTEVFDELMANDYDIDYEKFEKYLRTRKDLLFTRNLIPVVRFEK